MITIATMVACGVPSAQAQIFAGPLDAAAQRFDIKTRIRIAAFVTQWAVETGDFKRLEEDLRYTTVEAVFAAFKRLRPLGAAYVQEHLLRQPERLANAAYAFINGNHDEASGDGWTYRGRGPCMLSGLANYQDAEDGLGRPYVKQPDLVSEPADGALVAGWFWHCRKCNVLADGNRIDEITRAINGRAMLKADERRVRFIEAMKAMP
jgi:putative chitinase